MLNRWSSDMAKRVLISSMLMTQGKSKLTILTMPPFDQHLFVVVCRYLDRMFNAQLRFIEPQSKQ